VCLYIHCSSVPKLLLAVTLISSGSFHATVTIAVVIPIEIDPLEIFSPNLAPYFSTNISFSFALNIKLLLFIKRIGKRICSPFLFSRITDNQYSCGSKVSEVAFHVSPALAVMSFPVLMSGAIPLPK